jgi:hypothetical protein
VFQHLSVSYTQLPALCHCSYSAGLSFDLSWPQISGSLRGLNPDYMVGVTAPPNLTVAVASTVSIQCEVVCCHVEECQSFTSGTYHKVHVSFFSI